MEYFDDTVKGTEQNSRQATFRLQAGDATRFVPRAAGVGCGMC
jgi:hypothetical protein